ncbi:hypothetical protein [Paenibacillus qinlingensis]|uniref:hypothetical protein n=1 Tax=Paenibacillus qinlingensis TaxID=1837343 RepID=UPI001563EF3F|nr:hypothetical protein [Paenibacillus qinlingensis]NQX62164.1 hypothetical protein [Paenibacillus qinlingensis]
MSKQRQQQPQIKFYASSDETKKAFKVFCARKGLSIQQVLEAYMMQLLDKGDAE